MKKHFLWITLILICFLVGCDETETTLSSSNDEIITYVGLEDAHVYLGESFQPLNGVTFTSSTQGDITSSVDTNEESNVLPLGVHIVTYQTHYENNEIFTVYRRVVVMYPEDESDNMLTNGDFTDNMANWNHSTYADYPSDVRFIIDPDLKRMQIIMTSASTMLSSPNIYQPNLELDSNQTYEISLLVSGTANTFFSIDIVELNPTLQVLGVILDTQTINVGVQDGEMQLVQFTFTPLLSSTTANLRVMFGQDDGNSPTGEIYIDNVKLIAVTE